MAPDFIFSPFLMTLIQFLIMKIKKRRQARQRRQARRRERMALVALERHRVSKAIYPVIHTIITPPAGQSLWWIKNSSYQIKVTDELLIGLLITGGLH